MDCRTLLRRARNDEGGGVWIAAPCCAELAMTDSYANTTNPFFFPKKTPKKRLFKMTSCQVRAGWLERCILFDENGGVPVHKTMSLGLLALAATVVSPLFADEGQMAHSVASPFSGFTLGAFLGHQAGSLKTDVQAFDPGPPVAWNHFAKGRLAGSALSGGVALGYGWAKNRFYLGSTVEADLSSLKTTLELERVNLTAKQSNSFGVRLRPGMVFCGQTLVHLTVGGTWAKWKMNANPRPTRTHRSVSLAKRRGGFTYGAGVQMKVTDRLRMGFEYLRTDFAKMPDMIQLNAAGANTFRYQVKPSDNRLLVNLTYRLGRR